MPGEEDTGSGLDLHEAFGDPTYKARKALSSVKTYKVDTLERGAELGSAWAFVEALEPARALQQLLALIPDEVFPHLSPHLLQKVEEEANSALTCFQNILNFDPKAGLETSQLQKQKEELVRSLVKVQHNATHSLGPVFVLAALATRDDEAVVRKERELQDILAAARDSLAEISVQKSSEFFGDEADRHADVAGKWQWAVIALTVLLSVYAAIGLGSVLFPGKYYFPPAPETDEVILHLAGAKLLFFAVLSYAVYFCARNLAASRHNAVINKHRANALSTYRALVESSGDEEGRELILNHAATAIFSPQPSGYDTKSVSAPGAPGVVQNFMGGGSSG